MIVLMLYKSSIAFALNNLYSSNETYTQYKYFTTYILTLYLYLLHPLSRDAYEQHVVQKYFDVDKPMLCKMKKKLQKYKKHLTKSTYSIIII